MVRFSSSLLFLVLPMPDGIATCIISTHTQRERVKKRESKQTFTEGRLMVGGTLVGCCLPRPEFVERVGKAKASVTVVFSPALVTTISCCPLPRSVLYG